MSVYHSTCLIADDFDISAVARENVHFAFRLDLPFRLRLGSQYHKRLDVQSRTVDLWLRNDVPITAGQTVPEILARHSDIRPLLTRAVLVIVNPDIGEEDLDKLRNSNPRCDELFYPQPTTEVFAARQALNRFVVAYGTGSGHLFGGTPLRLFRPHDFLDCVRWEVTIIGPEQEEASTEEVAKVFSLSPEREIIPLPSLCGDVFDLSPEEIDGIDRALSLDADYVFYEHAFEAKSKMWAGDYVGALLMATAALEGAHAAFVGIVIEGRLPEEAKRDLSDEYIRELGITLCNQLTPYLLMDENERPSAELIRAAEKGLRLRNEIMHALRNRRGEYRTRLRTNQELIEGYSAMLKLYECYRHAFEKRL